MSNPPPAAIPTDIKPVEPPRQFAAPQLGLALAEVDRLIRANEARNLFHVDGNGLTAAVLDTGLNTTHVDFIGRIVAQRNFTTDNGSDSENASDGQGHGTNVGGIIAANGDHRGVAPGASIVPLKVLSNTGNGSFSAVADALKWVLDNRVKHSISAVCMSLGAGDNRTSDAGLEQDTVKGRIAALREQRVAVVIAAGNDYFTHNSKQGMSYPAILRQCVSVGAVYDEFEGAFSYSSGAATTSSGPDRITPFSQRLHESVDGDCHTDIFAPGAPVTSAGIGGPRGESVQHGTSQATPVTVGVILLLQQLHKRLTGELPTVDDLVETLRRGGVAIHDGDDEADNVQHTGLDFRRVDAVGALEAVARSLQKTLFLTGKPLGGSAVVPA
jgi:subtilisin family serine protease